jgi:hypothetical protein
LLRLFPPAVACLTAQWPGQELEGTMIGFDGMWWFRRNFHTPWLPTGIPTPALVQTESNLLSQLRVATWPQAHHYTLGSWGQVIQPLTMNVPVCQGSCAACRQRCEVHRRDAPLCGLTSSRCGCGAGLQDWYPPLPGGCAVWHLDPVTV